MGQGSGVAMSCGVGCRRSSDPELLWLWCRPVATAPIRPLAWEPPYAAGVDQINSKKTHTQKNQERKIWLAMPIVVAHNIIWHLFALCNYS